ncbi:MAG: thiosulfate oxidation carrier protein SoxY [Hyphomicrobiaceae bacterium]|nr:thiosulfate oxidation carrier protein SoxY [Hyphomicrobiaceae bacterium]
MSSPTDSSVLDRRSFLLGTAAVAAIAPFLGAAAQDAAPQTWEEAVKKIAGDAQPVTDGKRLTFELPETAENGNMVPFSVAVDSPMNEKEHVRAIHVIATANPQPSVASFRFTPLSGRAAVASRMRLAGTQDVIGLAELSNGTFVMTRRPVKVVIGGFSG